MSASFSWLDPSIWKDERSDAFRSSVAELSDDEVSFLRGCFVLASQPATQLRVIDEGFVVIIPGFPGASEKVRDAGRKIIGTAIRAAHAGEGGARS